MARQNLGAPPVDAVDAVTKEYVDAKADKTDTVTYVDHGATAGTSRPTGFDMVIWTGTVEPTNASNGDLWVDQT